MLTSDKKQKIDSLHQTLVGVMPVPATRVEQITLALIYKFMSDIDEENKELGGKSFFNGEYKKYAWPNLMDQSLSGQERVARYSEGLEQMSTNKNLPQLFRKIFKDAYLPFRDPEVLNLFLKQINEFSYTHSEDLGDVFEYNLAKMNSQGEAGQFRTPRHIIDFIVKAVDPKKTDTILDPACGTAGFLIAAYKHILEQNKDKDSRPGGALTPTERQRLMKNIVGYDVSHNFVQLSLANMYLHDFPEPRVYEYNTLASTDRWDDDFDCILANPPFFSPQGGVRPHNKFSVKSTRAEILFMDYIMEHLTPHGKAGIIVPESIIFNPESAFTQIRKKLIDDNLLYAVVSLPAGSFKPYSPVKTSLLLLDKKLAQNSDQLLFFDVKSDGYDLGDQRNPIEENDLPQAVETIQAYKDWLADSSTKASFEKFIESRKSEGVDGQQNWALISKEIIRNEKTYNLSAKRYASQTIQGSDWPYVQLGEVSESQYGVNLKASDKEGPYRFLRITDISEEGELKHTNQKYVSPTEKEVEKYTLKEGDILVARSGSVGRMFLYEGNEPMVFASYLVRLKVDPSRLLPSYLFYLSKSKHYWNQVWSLTSQVAQPNLNAQLIKSIQIPLPPLETQKEIIAKIENEEKKIVELKKKIGQQKEKIQTKISEIWGKQN